MIYGIPCAIQLLLYETCMYWFLRKLKYSLPISCVLQLLIAELFIKVLNKIDAKLSLLILFLQNFIYKLLKTIIHSNLKQMKI